MPRRLPVAIILASLFVGFAGCSSEEFQVAPVSGRVTLDGKPVEKAAVMFQPVATKGNINPGPGSFGITDAEGRYTLELVGLKRRGAAVGHHQVRIINYSEAGDTTDDSPNKKVPRPTVPIPAWYNKIEPLLEYDVRKGSNTDADFALSSKPPSAKPAGAK
jgi:hypothetical protein